MIMLGPRRGRGNSGKTGGERRWLASRDGNGIGGPGRGSAQDHFKQSLVVSWVITTETTRLSKR
jgi:hypothetical protein